MSGRFSQLFLQTIISLTRMFPIWAILFSVIAYFAPSFFLSARSFMPELLMFVMFSMGLTLSIDDFKRVITRPKAVIVCTLLHYVIMPLLAFLIAHLFTMRLELLVGMVLVGSVASNSASNVVVYLAKGDVALSITVSAISVLLGIFVTPLILFVLLGSRVPVELMSILFLILKIVFIPLFAGLLARRLLFKVVKKCERFYPVLSMICVLMILGIVVAGGRDLFTQVGFTVICAVILHHGLGLLSGYWGGRLFGFDESTCRTISLQVGMQSSALAATLGTIYFSALSAAPAVVSSIWHNISGSLLANYWQNKPIKKVSKK